MPTAISSNPNASITALAGAMTILVVWSVGQFGLSVPAEVGSALTTLVAGLILWKGRREQLQLQPEAAEAASPA